MAESVMDPNELFLYDLVPGPITFDLPPADASGDVFGNPSHCNVSSPYVRVGTKVAVYSIATDGTTSQPGWSIVTYLRFQNESGATAVIGDLCCHPTGSTIPWYDVSQESDSGASDYGPFAAIACVAMTDNYYGWFWTGGVLPHQHAPDLAADTDCIYTATNDVAAGSYLSLTDGATIGKLAVDIYDIAVLTSVQRPLIGMALAADD